MSHARWQVIGFVSQPPLLFFVKMFNFSLIQNLHLVMRINFFPVFSLIFIFDARFQAGMPKGRIRMSQRSNRLPAVLRLLACLHMIYFTKQSVAQVLYGTDAITQSCVINKILKT